MLDVTIKGFQSIDEVSLTIEGFTALVGRSNIGKSAVVRAVRAALTNALGTDFVRHGSFCSRRIRGTKKCKCSCSVHLKSDDFDLLWEKGDEVNQYTYNGQVYSRSDRGVPDFLQEFSLVKVGSDKKLIQVADQSEPIFLLNQSGTAVADVLADVAKLDDINVAMADVEKDRREAVSTLKVRERDLLELQTSLLPYEGLDEPVRRSREVSQFFESVQEVFKKKDQVDQFHAKLHELGQGIRALQPVEVVEVPDVEPVGAFEKGFSALLRYEADLDLKTSEVGYLEPVEALAVPDESPLEEDSLRLSQLEGWLTDISAFREIFSRWKEVETAPDPSEITLTGIESLLQLESMTTTHTVLEAAVDELSGVELISDLDHPVQDVEGLIKVSSLVTTHDSLESALGTLQTTLSEVEAQEQTLLQEWVTLGVCPTCSQSVSDSHQIHFDA